jgi:hypothetical protein
MDRGYRGKSAAEAKAAAANDDSSDGCREAGDDIV